MGMGRAWKGSHALTHPTFHVPGEPGAKPLVEDLLLGRGFVGNRAASLLRSIERQPLTQVFGKRKKQTTKKTSTFGKQRSWHLVPSHHRKSVQFSDSVMSDSLRPHGLQHTRLPCVSPTPGTYSNSCPLSWRCHPTISSSVVPFSSHLQSFPASGSFPISQFFVSGPQSIGVSPSESVLLMNIQH